MDDEMVGGQDWQHPERPAWQQRVLEERVQLADRLSKLKAYLADYKPRDDNRRLLIEQARHMEDYLDVLDQRVASWEKADA